VQLVVLLAVAANGKPLSAEPKREKIAILRLSVDGDMSREALRAFEKSIDNGLGNAGFQAVTWKAMRRQLDDGRFWRGCTFGPCLKTLYRATGIRLALLADIRGAGHNYEFVITIVDATTGIPASQTVDQCTVCSVDDAVTAATFAVIGLVTGAGRVVVTDPEAGPTASGGVLDPAAGRVREQELESQVKARQRRARRTAYVAAAGAAFAAAVGGGLWVTDRHTPGYVTLGVSSGLAVASIAIFALSADF
jgi:hypothetical protein